MTVLKYYDGAAWVAFNSAAGYDGVTSATSVLIGTGSKTWTFNILGAFNLGSRVRVADNAAPSANWCEGVITGVSGLAVTVTVDIIGGSGTKASWNVSLAGSALDINSLTTTGEALVDADTFPIYDASQATARKSLMSRIATYIFAKVSSDITMTSAGVATMTAVERLRVKGVGGSITGGTAPEVSGGGYRVIAGSSVNTLSGGQATVTLAGSGFANGMVSLVITSGDVGVTTKLVGVVSQTRTTFVYRAWSYSSTAPYGTYVLESAIADSRVNYIAVGW